MFTRTSSPPRKNREKYGFGPWAFIVDNQLSGWGGLQPEDDDIDLGIVLHPDFWGLGKEIFDRLVKFAFGEMYLKSIIILLPPSRTRIKAILRLGFVPDGEIDLFGERFKRFRLYNPDL